MSMWSGISQFKQTLSDELQQASGSRKPSVDAVSTIERNAKFLNADHANIDDIISTSGDSDQVNSNEADKKTDGDNSQESKKQKDSINEKAPAKAGEGEQKPPHLSTEVEKNTPNDETEPSKEDVEISSKQSTSPDTGANPDLGKQDNQTSEKQANHLNATSRNTSSSNLPGSSASTSKDISPQADAALNAKLAKFAKYESMYPRLSKAYREEKKRNDLVRLYEKVLSENTPCSSIAEPKRLIDYSNDIKSKTSLQHTEIGRIGTELSTVKKQNEMNKQELKEAHESISKLKCELEKCTTELESTKAELSKVKNDKETSEKDALIQSELKARIELSESQLSVAEQARDAAIKSMTALRSQLDESNVRLKETFAETESLRDESHDSERLAQERLEELTSVKNALRTRDKGTRDTATKADFESSNLISEKDLLESEVESLNKRIIRESEQLQLQIKSSKTRSQESEAHEEESRKQVLSQTQALARAKSQQHLPTLTSARPSTDHTSTGVKADNLESDDATSALQLAEAKEAAANAAKANELLKQVHKDNALRIEKLQKSQKALMADIEHLRHENSQLKRRQSICSIDSGKGGEERDKQQAYLKNVSLGFIEHKDQRKALSPVSATLLNLKESETEKFLNGFA